MLCTGLRQRAESHPSPLPQGGDRGDSSSTALAGLPLPFHPTANQPLLGALVGSLPCLPHRFTSGMAQQPQQGVATQGSPLPPVRGASASCTQPAGEGTATPGRAGVALWASLLGVSTSGETSSTKSPPHKPNTLSTEALGALGVVGTPDSGTGEAACLCCHDGCVAMPIHSSRIG